MFWACPQLPCGVQADSAAETGNVLQARLLMQLTGHADGEIITSCAECLSPASTGDLQIILVLRQALFARLACACCGRNCVSRLGAGSLHAGLWWQQATCAAGLAWCCAGHPGTRTQVPTAGSSSTDEVRSWHCPQNRVPTCCLSSCARSGLLVQALHQRPAHPSAL